MTLQHASGKDAQIQLHVSVLDEKYRGRWQEFRKNTVSIWQGTIAQFGSFSAVDLYVDGRPAFTIHGTILGQVQGHKAVDMFFAPLGDNRLFEMHLTRNRDSPVERELVAAYELIRSTIRFDRDE